MMSLANNSCKLLIKSVVFEDDIICIKLAARNKETKKKKKKKEKKRIDIDDFI